MSGVVARSRLHAVVLCHGLLGSPSHVSFISKCVAEAHPDALIYTSTANTGPLSSVRTTTDGVDAGGARLGEEIRRLLRDRPRVERLSLVGVSLGGLLARSALGSLGDLPVELVNYVSFATPHLGVRRHLLPLVDLAVERGIIGA